MKVLQCMSRSVNTFIMKSQEDLKTIEPDYNSFKKNVRSYNYTVKEDCKNIILRTIVFNKVQVIKDDFLRQQYYELAESLISQFNSQVATFLIKDCFKNMVETNKRVDDYFKILKKEVTNTVKVVNEYFKNPQKMSIHKGPEQLGLSISNEKQSVSDNNQIPDNKTKIESNYEIKNNDLHYGGLKQKCKNNIEAIKLIKKTTSSINLEQKKTLVKYSGWGGLPGVFDNNNSKWNEERKLLKELLTEEEYSNARAGTLNEHYTPKEVIEFIYKSLDKMGVNNAKVLEPACGTGNFIGLIPKNMVKKITGIELDSISGKISQYLYEDANIIITPYEKSYLQYNHFDLVVSNVPFGSYKIFDPQYNNYNLLIHDYFIVKSLDHLREDGIMAVITSKGTLDKKDTSVRELINQKAELIAAVRLPNVAFKKSANTEVTADILFFRKRLEGEQINNKFINVYENKQGIQLNEYYINNPHMLLGTMNEEIKLYGHKNTTLKANENWQDDMNKIIKYIPEDIYVKDTRNIDKCIDTLPLAAVRVHVKEYGFCEKEGQVYQRENNELKLVNVKGKKTLERLIHLIELREITMEYINDQMDIKKPEDILECERYMLNRIYDKFVSKYGLINNRINKSLFKEDPDFPVLLALEDEKNGKWEKTEIFYKRTLYPIREITHVNTSKEALIVSLNRYAKVDLEYMAKLTDKSIETVIQELKGKIYKDPNSCTWVTAEEYLSGNVREKLQIAKEYQNSSKGYNDNYKALSAVQPKDLEAHEIIVKLGATWIPSDIIEDYIAFIFQTKRDIHVSYSKVIATWSISYSYIDNILNYRTFGTSRVSGIKLLQNTLNQKQVKIFDIQEVDGSETRVLNKKETLLARQKQDDLKRKFQEWIFEEPDRRNRIVKIYNELFNSFRTREYNGKDLTFPGMNNNIKLRQHQLDSVARILFGGNTLLAHVVGAGKTFTMIGAAMKLRQVGLAKKSLFVVPNHLINQWSAEFIRLYPSAKILAATKDDFKPQNRKRLFARIATGDWDAIIVAHSSFKKINVDPEYTKEFMKKQIDDIKIAIMSEKDERIPNTRLIKQLETTQKRLESEMKMMLKVKDKDNTLTFDQLGIDFLFVDEAHEFKNLYVYTKMGNVAGIPQTKSQKAFDLFVKSQYIINRYGNGVQGLTFATGTPISNSMTEMYTMQRYMQLSKLEKFGLSHFDAWASTFGEQTTALEISPDGSGYRMKTRFRKFNNLPELLMMFKEFADVKTADMLKLPVPNLKGGKPITIECEPTEELIDFIGTLVKRAESIHSGSVDPRVDNMLLITNEGRKAALDLRLIYPDAEISNKILKAVDNIYNVWEQTKKQKLTQLVFCDLSTPSKEFNIYDEVKNKLIEKGVPQEEIEYIHNANTDIRKEKLFSNVKEGNVRILMGSTAKMGAGTNVQDRLIALHHLDAPWRPSDIEQREGRILRQGNKNLEWGNDVMIFRYVTKGSFDAYSWQLLETKARFIGQIMSGDVNVRTADDVDDTSLSFAEVKAIASGNPMIMEKMEVDTEIQRLSVLKSGYKREWYNMQDTLAILPNKIDKLEKVKSQYEEDLKARKNINDNKFSMVIFNNVFNDPKKAGIALNESFKDLAADGKKEIGNYRGFKIIVSYYGIAKKIMLTTNSKGNDNIVECSKMPLTTINRMNNKLDSFEEEIKDVCTKIEKNRISVNNIQDALNKPFEYEEKLQELIVRQKELDALLNKDNEEKQVQEIA
ncbi:hypothetical protein SH1V18_48180 [Vallitalea longa]|uniref:Helicase ATP-binding domain-containing protein n=1 Tax=Vallitalea longa TaxID=2936439 RepID=A0A9W5YJ76_9FIRM|nr:DEAD/DEAH box helicase family protein [Vallitalea longa]GKX32338.1 hypothetical protein SH1V18_48180 [Vallitalea longa]